MSNDKNLKRQKPPELLAIIRDRLHPMEMEPSKERKTPTQMLFLHLFDRMEDSGLQDGCWYSLGNVLCLALLCVGQLGRSSSTAVADRIYTRRRFFYDMGLLKKRDPGESEEHIPGSDLIEVPSHNTIRRILTLVDPQKLDLYLSMELPKYLRAISTLCQQSRKNLPIDDTMVPLSAIQVLNFDDYSTAVCFDSGLTPAKADGTSQAEDYLRRLILKNTIVTFDALHTDGETMAMVSGRKGICVAPVGDHQKELRNEIQAGFEKWEKKVTHASMEDRDFDFCTLPKSYAVDGFTGMKIFIRVNSCVCRDGDFARYFIANTADTQLIMETICDRGEIENGCHREKDWLVDENGVILTNRYADRNITVMDNYIVACARLCSALTGMEFRLAKDAIRNSPETVFALICSCMNDQELRESICQQLEAGKRKRRMEK